LGIVLLSLCFSLIQTGHSFAATQNITLSPTSVDVTLDPGSINKGSVEIINTGDSAFAFRTYVTPYHVTGEEYQQEFTPLPGAPDVTKWITVNSSLSSLVPGKLTEIPYTITVPKGTPAGGYYAVLFAETKAPPAKNGVIVTDRVGEIFYITVSGALTQKGQVASWTTKYFQKPPLSASLRLENSGSTHYLATVQVRVKDIFGSSKFTFNTKKQVLPQTIRRIDISWPKTPSFGLFKVAGTATFLDQTHQLPTHYVLVMSSTVRLIFIGVVVGLLIVSIVIIYRKKHAKPKFTSRS